MWQKCKILIYFTTIVVSANSASIEKIQQENIEILNESLTQGWKAFCEAPVHEGVMSLFDGINPSDTTIHVLTLNNQSVELPIRSLSELRDFDINPKRKTLLYINGFYTADTFFSIQSHLHMLQSRRRELNVIIVNFAKDIQQLYYALRHHLTLQGYFVAKILEVLIENGIDPKDITVAGHSVGANVAALGISTYSEEYFNNYKQISIIGQLIAIDPCSYICGSSDLYVRRNISSRVVVIHGEGNVFGVRSPMGSIDIYPNGIGYYPKRRLQPGCNTSVCSHMYPFLLFMEALVEEVNITAVKCESWLQFREQNCDYTNTVELGITYPETAKGLYFCVTQSSPPFTLKEQGLKYISRSKRK
ncbi:lipase member I [Lucilia cuprina]|uniref:lipase member I n=1 Tax=Lucilia cuprina TaxID=7375 RepID=UPI001F059320|nr:lipase member I [Lucilia cuprina]